MKKSSLIFTVILLLSAILTNCKKESTQTVTVVRDCTGTYLRWHEKDYQVCNLEKVFSFPHGAVVAATFSKIKECNGSAKDEIVCLMLHPNEGRIEVNRINY